MTRVALSARSPATFDQTGRNVANHATKRSRVGPSNRAGALVGAAGATTPVVYSLMDRAPEVEQLLRDLMARAKAGDADGVGELFAPGAATLLVGSEPGDWYPDGEAAVVHLRDSLEKYGVVPFEPYAPVAWSEGSVAWFADRPTIVFPQVRIPVRITGVAVGGADGWRIVQIHFSSGVPDEPLLNG